MAFHVQGSMTILMPRFWNKVENASSNWVNGKRWVMTLRTSTWPSATRRSLSRQVWKIRRPWMLLIVRHLNTETYNTRVSFNDMFDMILLHRSTSHNFHELQNSILNGECRYLDEIFVNIWGVGQNDIFFLLPVTKISSIWCHFRFLNNNTRLLNQRFSTSWHDRLGKS